MLIFPLDGVLSLRLEVYELLGECTLLVLDLAL